MESQPTRHGLPRSLLRLARAALKLVAALALVLVTILLGDAWRSRSRLQTSIWQEQTPAVEFRARDARRGARFDDYLAMEERLFADTQRFYIPEGEGTRLTRYVDGGRFDPRLHEPDWNRTVVLEPEGETRGGALLLHGLTDSPYSLHTLAELLASKGFYVVCLRMPGHGTVPAGLLDVSWRDWTAAAEVAAAHVRDRIGDDAPFYVAGYSMGGAVAVRCTIEAVERYPAAAPDRVLLFSPAIGVTPFARISNIHVLVSWIPYFHDYRWLTVEPEYDPFKYTSFPKNAGRQMWLLTNALEQTLAAAKARGVRPPPILTFQSIVDETVVARQTHARLYERLGRDDWEFVIFDVNRVADLDEFFRRDFRSTIERLEQTTLPYRLTIVTNASEGSPAVVARTKQAGAADIAERPLGLEWPAGLFSLSHIAITFAIDDPVYGLEPTTALPLGRLALRGERNVLRISPGQMLRVRSNPFEDYIRRRVGAIVDLDLATKPLSSAP